MAGQPLSVASMIGFITLTGIASRNGILKISHYINLALHENMPFGRELVVRGSLERMTPVLMTALAAGLALLPLMIDAGAPGKEVLHPVAITIFGGPVQRHAARCLSHADPVPAVRRETARAPARKRAGDSSRTARPVQPMPTDNKEMNHEATTHALLAALLIAADALCPRAREGPQRRTAGRCRRLSRRDGRQGHAADRLSATTTKTSRSTPKATRPPAFSWSAASRSASS